MLETIIDLCHQAKDFKALKENLLLLSKRRQALKQPVKSMVKKAMGWIEEYESDQKMELINTLISITDGKVCCLPRYNKLIYLDIRRKAVCETQPAVGND